MRGEFIRYHSGTLTQICGLQLGDSSKSSFLEDAAARGTLSFHSLIQSKQDIGTLGTERVGTRVNLNSEWSKAASKAAPNSNTSPDRSAMQAKAAGESLDGGAEMPTETRLQKQNQLIE